MILADIRANPPPVVNHSRSRVWNIRTTPALTRCRRRGVACQPVEQAFDSIRSSVTSSRSWRPAGGGSAVRAVGKHPDVPPVQPTIARRPI